MKPIIATTLSGLFVKSDPWKKAHEGWFRKVAKKLKDDSFLHWLHKENYFEGVDLAMKKLYPHLSDEQRTKKARKIYFNAVCEYMEIHPEIQNTKVIEFFEELKKGYRVALLTTNTLPALKRILDINCMNNFFDIIENSLPKEKDDKSIVIDRFLKKYGKPVIYIGGERKESYALLKNKGVSTIFVNLENKENIPGVETVFSLDELKKKIIALKEHGTGGI